MYATQSAGPPVVFLKSFSPMRIDTRSPSWPIALLSAALVFGGALSGAVAQPAGPLPVVATSELSPEIAAEVMYRLLVGDIALQRGEPAIAARAYFEAARDAQDAGLARRATEVALFARQRALALEAAKLWQKLDPSAERARQMVTTLAQDRKST